LYKLVTVTAWVHSCRESLSQCKEWCRY